MLGQRGEDDVDALMRTRRRWTGHPRNAAHEAQKPVAFFLKFFSPTAVCRHHQAQAQELSAVRARTVFSTQCSLLKR